MKLAIETPFTYEECLALYDTIGEEAPEIARIAARSNLGLMQLANWVMAMRARMKDGAPPRSIGEGRDL